MSATAVPAASTMPFAAAMSRIAGMPWFGTRARTPRASLRRQADRFSRTAGSADGSACSMATIGTPNVWRLGREAQQTFAAGDLATAETIARQLVAHDCADAEAFDLLVDVLARTGRTAEAIALQRALLAHMRTREAGQTQVFGMMLLHERGFRPTGLIDVGAYHGEFSLLARQFWPQASVLMIEPQQQKRPNLEAVAAELAGDVQVRTTLVGDRTEAACAFHVMSTPWGSTGSSLYPENNDLPREVVAAPMTTLDALAGALPGRRFDLLKLDVQGAELDVLRGAGATMAGVEVVFVELSLHECNRGAPRIAAVTAELDRQGFAMFDVMTPPRDARRLVVQVEAIFVRRESALWP
ncbi:MAG: FkbM family methyltransferase [Planctomycetota bacterium]